MEKNLGKLTTDQKFHFEANTVQTLGDIDVESFSVSHDAADPMFFSFRHADKHVALVTDLGYVSDRIKQTIKGADAYVFEANHDVSMLQMCRYPWSRSEERRVGKECRGRGS